MNISFINFNKNWGGVKTWTLDFGREMQKLGHSITVIARPDTPFADECGKAGFHTYTFRPGFKYNPLSIYRTYRILKRSCADICIVNISKDINIGAVMAKIANVPVIRRVGLPQDYRHNTEENLLALLTDAVIVPSNTLKQQISGLPYLKNKEIFVLPNSKNPELYIKKTEENKNITIGVTSQLSVTKGHRYLLDALKILKDKGMHPELKIAGTGRNEKDIKEYVNMLGLDENVNFCGFIRDIPDFLAGLDIYVLPSLTENFPNTLVEAVFSGLPCIAFNTGGIPEVIGDAGILIEKKDTAGLADQLEKLITNPDLRKELGEKAKKRALENFNLKTNSLKLENIFKKVYSVR